MVATLEDSRRRRAPPGLKGVIGAVWFLNRRPLLDETYAGWMFDVYAWALRNFDPRHVPQRKRTGHADQPALFQAGSDSPDEMAHLIF